MKRRSRAGGQPVKARRRKAVTLKRRTAAKAVRRHGRSAGNLQEQLDLRTRELNEALERQTATSEVLQVISSSPGDVEPVFATMLENAARICDAKFGNIFRWDGDALHLVATHNTPPAFAEARRSLPLRPNKENPIGRVLATRTVIHVADLAGDERYTERRDPDVVAAVELGGIRTFMAVPMLKENNLIGALIVYRQEVRPFTDKQIELVKNFAAQAVIAIENTRLLNELRESLQQQSATADVLKVISRSTFDLPKVLYTLLESAARLCEADKGQILRPAGKDASYYAPAANYRHTPEYEEHLKTQAFAPGRGGIVGRVLLEGKSVQISDVLADSEYAFREIVELGDFRTILGVPLLREGVISGLLVLHRAVVRPFSDRQIKLVELFADQAVIAIENARLFEAEQQRTRELAESLEQQTATSEVLRVISSSPGDLEPVFESMLANAMVICEAKFGHLLLYSDESFHAAHLRGVPPSYREFWDRGPVRPSPNTALGRLVRTKQVVQIPDIQADLAYAEGEPLRVATVELAGARTLLAVPMLKERQLVGAIVFYRQEVRPFSDKQIALVTNFANQAVIAIENTRLLSELRESLEQQTATSEVLKVISRSTFDLQSVLDTLIESAARLCAADMGSIQMQEGDVYRIRAHYGLAREAVQYALLQPLRPGRSSVTGRVALEGKAIHIPDVLADPEYHATDYQQAFGYRTILGVPLLRDGATIGVFSLTRVEVSPFNEKQMELVTTFADQAVIAVENARLLSELRESLEQQTATSDVLEVISRSPGELEPVFEAMLENAVRICGAKFGNLWLYDGEFLRIGATTHGAPGAYVEYLRREGPFRVDPRLAAGRLVQTKRTYQVADITAQPTHDDKVRVATIELAGARTLLGVPMLKDGKVIGLIVIYRREVLPFTDKQVALVENFAVQAVIAIENARLLSELRESLQQQTATADVLKVISRSAFDLQTVLDALVESAARLCDADSAAIHRPIGNSYPYVASYGYTREYHEYMRERPIIPGRGTVLGRAVTECKPVQVNDVEADPEYTLREGQRLGGFRTVLGIPLLREGAPIGVIVLTRNTVWPFTDKQIELATTFADQAAIAIENVRLFEAEQQRTQELARSIEDLRTAQDRLIQTEKLASLGQLTAGIAHEIKNPLNFVNNFSGVSTELIDELRDVLSGISIDHKARTAIDELTDTLRGNLDKVVQHGMRADAIVKNMLLHSRQGSGEHRPVDINSLVDESLNLAYHGARAEKQGFTITLERSFDPAAGEADLFPQEITRALLNLISNGFYAATKRKAEASGGDYEPTLAAATKNLGDRVEIRIHDNGTGIPPEVKEKLFNPFFTTKPAGEGTGLGLSISHDIIVKQHGGSIEVDTQPGVFTEFRIVLPRAGVSLIKSGERA
jgi:GAF domain-containing protein